MKTQLGILSFSHLLLLPLAGTLLPVDGGYTATPSTNIPAYEDTGGVELTDGEVGTTVWPNPAEPVPLVGWQFLDPEITCNFATEVNIGSVVAWFADSDGSAGVGLPESIRLTTPGGFDQTFPVENPEGSGNTVPITIDGLDLNTESITLFVARDTALENTQCCSGNFEWIMMSEVQFFSPPDPTQPLAVFPPSVDLGMLGNDPAIVPGTFEVANADTVATDLTLESVAFSGPDADRFAVTDFPASLAPGVSGEVSFTFDTRGEVGSFSATVEIASNDADSPASIPVTLQTRNPDPEPTTAYQQAVVRDGAILYWTFDEAGDTDNAASLVDALSANELVPQGGATRTESTTTTGGISLGRAASFDGAGSSRFLAENLARTDLLTSFAVEFWFRSDATGDRYFSEMFNESGSPNQPGLIYNYNPGQVEIFNGDRTGAMAPPDQWHHLVFASYGEGGGVEIYLNNELQSTFTDTFAGVHAFGQFAIGNTVRNAAAIVGEIDEYAIYNLDPLADLEAKRDKAAQIAGHFALGAELEIEDLEIEADGMLRLTWKSQPGANYAVSWSRDLINFDGEVANAVSSQGDFTEFRFPNPTITPEFPDGEPRFFLRVSEAD